MKLFDKLFAMGAIGALALAAHAADYPERQVRIIVPFQAGGAADSVARVLAGALADRLGQSFIVENRTGAEGAIAGQTVATAPADGHAILYAVSATAALPIVAKTTYDMDSDFTPLSTVGIYEFGMMVSPKVPATSVGEFITYVKANPGKVNFATLNLGEHLAASLFMHAAGVEMTRVPYRSMTQILPDMVDGRTHLNFGPVFNAIAWAKAGRMRLLATLSAERSALAPDVVTMREIGFPDVAFESTQMLFVRAATPRAIVDRLSREVNAILAKADERAKLEKFGLRVHGSTPDELSRALVVANQKWARFARENKLGGEP